MGVLTRDGLWLIKPGRALHSKLECFLYLHSTYEQPVKLGSIGDSIFLVYEHCVATLQGKFE